MSDEKVQCSCGSSVLSKNMSQHIKTKKHLSMVEKQDLHETVKHGGKKAGLESVAGSFESTIVSMLQRLEHKIDEIGVLVEELGMDFGEGDDVDELEDEEKDSPPTPKVNLDVPKPCN